MTDKEPSGLRDDPGEPSNITYTMENIACGPSFTSVKQTRFTDVLSHWFASQKRLLPFRSSTNPYHIWISEIMGQQTRMTALLPYYNRFITRFPTIQSLAKAEEDEVLAEWAGLGYYTRARNLRTAARIVMEQYGGALPMDHTSIRALPGIGDYTAGAICSIAYGQQTPAVDGNVRRVFARLTADNDADPAPAIRTWMEEAAPAVVTEGLMELGALICLPSTPHCGACPATTFCRAFQEGKTDQFPAKRTKAAKREEQVASLLIQNKDGLWLLRRRTERLLHGMWEFPSEDYLTHAAVPFTRDDRILGQHRHIFTHIIWHMKAYRAALTHENTPPDCAWFSPDNLPALPSAMRAFGKLTAIDNL